MQALLPEVSFTRDPPSLALYEEIQTKPKRQGAARFRSCPPWGCGPTGAWHLGKPKPVATAAVLAIMPTRDAGRERAQKHPTPRGRPCVVLNTQIKARAPARARRGRRGGRGPPPPPRNRNNPSGRYTTAPRPRGRSARKAPARAFPRRRQCPQAREGKGRRKSRVLTRVGKCGWMLPMLGSQGQVCYGRRNSTYGRERESESRVAERILQVTLYGD